MKIFSERLCKTLKETKMSQTELAKRVGMSQSVINNYCTGKREPTLEVLVKICNVLDESADYLLGIKKL